MTEQVNPSTVENVQETVVEVIDGDQPPVQKDQEAPAPIVPQHQKPVVSNTGKPAQQAVKPQPAAQPVVADANGLSQSALHVIGTIEEYIDKMNPRLPQSPETGAGYQRRLYRALKTTIEGLNPTEFQIVMRKLCVLIQENKDGVFKDTAAGRFAAYIPLDAAERMAFFSALALLTAAADPSTRRRVINQFDIHKGLRGGFSEDGCQRLKEFLEK